MNVKYLHLLFIQKIIIFNVKRQYPIIKPTTKQNQYKNLHK